MPRMRKKTLELDQDCIDRLRILLGARTEKAAVNKAMEIVLIDEEIIEAHRKCADTGDFLDEVFE